MIKTFEEHVAWNLVQRDHKEGKLEHISPFPTDLEGLPGNTRMGYINRAAMLIQQTGGSHLRVQWSKFLGDLAIARRRETSSEPLQYFQACIAEFVNNPPKAPEGLVAMVLIEMFILMQNDCDAEVLNSKINEYLVKAASRYQLNSSLADSITQRLNID